MLVSIRFKFMKIDLKNFFDSLISYCKKKNSIRGLYLISFLESIFFPIPTDVFMIPFILAKKKYVRIVVLTTFFSVFGGIVAYFIGIFLWENIETKLINFLPNVLIKIENFKTSYDDIGFLLILIGGFSPFPYKITCLASGILNLNFYSFLIASAISRGLRFFLVGYIFYKFNEVAEKLIRRWINIVSVILIIILGYFLLRI